MPLYDEEFPIPPRFKRQRLSFDSLQGIIDDQLFQAAATGDLDSLHRAILAGGDVNHQKSEFRFAPIHRAIAVDSPGCIKALINNGADPNVMSKDSLTALHLAARAGRFRCIRALVETKSPYISDAISKSCKKHFPDSLTNEIILFVGPHADVLLKDASGKTALDHAVRRKDPKITKYLYNLCRARIFH